MSLYYSPQIMRRKLIKTLSGVYLNSFSSNSIICSRISLSLFTNSPTRYIHLIRVLHPLFNLRVYRNPFNIQEGIYVVGRMGLVESFRGLLSYIIEKVEFNSRTYCNPGEWKEHRTQVVSQYKRNYIIRVMHILLDLKDELDAEIPPTQLSKRIQDSILIDEYVKSLPLLKSKKRLYGSKNIPPAFSDPGVTRPIKKTQS